MSMPHYNFTDRFRALYDQAIQLYAAGRRGAENFVDAEARTFLAANGLSASNLYDYAEDQASYGEPGYDRALAIELVRRDYFLNIQRGRTSGRILAEASLPPKDAAVEGIAWLPRLIPKTKAKLRGELPPSLMYCCGGDRRFFKEHDIQPAEFLNLVWRHLDDDAAIVRWTITRYEASRGPRA